MAKKDAACYNCISPKPHTSTAYINVNCSANCNLKTTANYSTTESKPVRGKRK
jgi:hypothetical protein